MLPCSPLFRASSHSFRVVGVGFLKKQAVMKVAQTLFTLFVSASSTAARERRTADSVNARLRGRFSAEGVVLKSDSAGAGAGGEEGRFEAGTPEFLKDCAGDSCSVDSDDCCSGYVCDKVGSAKKWKCVAES